LGIVVGEYENDRLRPSHKRSLALVAASASGLGNLSEERNVDEWLGKRNQLISRQLNS